ncbi:hypothetical protein KFL_008180030 [Klebsormidium nitens]|uniref:Uncharacterized protein n=1 Tax=Klebsormidium nitens TaxID=105231 RepID=A0A1Y1IQU0_KLENI|nr:hypothetical protein KFL_008180030 [Klebsormidium nitens]|eukprot:GAQ91611.1 hypothetical protein KFL_008180030 [Klebsormidium nitens]
MSWLPFSGDKPRKPSRRRGQDGCNPQLIPTGTRSPQRQFNAFSSAARREAGGSPLQDLPSPPPDQPSPQPDPPLSQPDLASGGASPAAYEHALSPEPRTSAVGQQEGPRFQEVRGTEQEGLQAAASQSADDVKRHAYVSFIKQCCGGKGLSRNDQNWLLSFADVPGLKGAADVQSYIDTLPQPAGWKRVNLARANGKDGQDLFLDYCDAYEAVLGLWRDPAHSGKLILKPVLLRNKKGERVYKGAHSGVWWHEMQKVIPLSDSVLALILYSDGTPLSLSGRQKVRPVVLSLANIPKELRGRFTGWVLVGYIPYVEPRPELGLSENSDALRTRQLQIWHESYETILRRLKLHTTTGLDVTDASGSVTKVWPMLYAVVTDWQEGCVAAATKSGNKTKCPCHSCLVLSTELNDFAAGSQADPRTEEKMRQIYEQVVRLHKKGGCQEVISQLLKAWSVNPVQNAFWNWPGGNTEAGNPYLSILPEIMHQLDHGILPQIFEAIGTYARDKFGPREGNRLLAKANLRYRSFRNSHPGLRLPNIDFLGGSSFVTAFEHRHCLSVAVFAVVGVFTLPNGRDEITTLLREVANAYLDFGVRHRGSGHTDSSLEKVDESWARVLKMLRKVLPYQASDWGTSKVHTTVHLSPSVRLKGGSDEYHADIFESSHKSTAKTPYRASNRFDMQLQMVKHVKDRLALRAAGADRFAANVNERALRVRAVKQKSNLLSIKGRGIRLARLSSHARAAGNWDSALRDQPELVLLERALRAHLGGNRRGTQALLENLPNVKDAKITRHLTLAIARARQPDGRLKTELARANPSFGKKRRPLFNDVVVQGEELGRNGGRVKVLWFAQLRLLFSCTDHKGKKRAYAFVRWYQKTGPLDVTNCIRLKWEKVKGSDGREVDRYGVVGIQSIKRLEHIIPDPNHENMYYVNAFRVV